MLKLSPDEAALLKAIAADRDNDLPRLVYADWLDDHGRPERAEFIRLQCHPPDPAGVAHEPRQQADGTWRVAAPAAHRAAREAELLATHKARWDRGLPKWAVGPRRYTRGFVEAFDIPAASFLRYGPQLLDRTPVRWLSLYAVRNVYEDVVRCGWLGEVAELWMENNSLGDADAMALTGAGWLVGLQVLSLGHNQMNDRAARTLAGCRHLRGLSMLSLANNRLTVAGVEALLASPHLVGCHFFLRGNTQLHDDPQAVRRLLGPRGTL